MSKRKASTSDHVKHEAAGWGTIILGGIALLFLAPALLGGLGGAVVSAVPDAADAATCWPTAPLCPPERVRQSSTPTTGAPKMTDQEMRARINAKATGDALAAARPVAPAPTPDPRGGLPAIGGAGSGGIVGELPAIGGAIRALAQGGGLKALNP